MDYFTRAHEKYHEWGAVAKSNALFKSIQWSVQGSVQESVRISSDHSTRIENERKRGLHN